MLSDAWQTVLEKTHDAVREFARSELLALTWRAVHRLSTRSAELTRTSCSTARTIRWRYLIFVRGQAAPEDDGAPSAFKGLRKR
jgi:hypothetical protein